MIVGWFLVLVNGFNPSETFLHCLLRLALMQRAWFHRHCLTVRGRGAVQSDLHGNAEAVLHDEGGADGDDLPGTALHGDGEDHSDRRQR